MPRLLSVIVGLLVVNIVMASDTTRSVEKRPGKVFDREAEPSQVKVGYTEWVKQHATGLSSGWFPASDGASKRVQFPLKLVVTAIEGDEPPADARHFISDRQVMYGCQVAADWRVQHFFHGPMGSKGGGYPTIAQDNRTRFDYLLSKLPDDGSLLPPAGRRLIVQVADGDHFKTRVYDRGNAPDEVWEIIRLSLCGIRSWVPEFKSENDLPVGRYETFGILALTPTGQLVSAVMHGQLQFWDSVRQEKLKELPLPRSMVPQGIKFSPDGSLAVLTGWGQSNCCVVDTTTWKVLRDFREPMIGRYGGHLYFPQFSADGQLLLFLCHRPDAEGHVTILPRSYDTKTWEKHDTVPGLPDNALTCIEAAKSKRAVVFLKGNVVALWDSERHREYAKLDKDAQLHQVAFSPDESLVAISTIHKREPKSEYWTIYRIRIWKMDTGALVHELRPFEQGTCENVVGLQWSADGQYILAATKADSFFTNCDIGIWNLKSGRQRGNLSGGLSRPMGVVILPDGRHIAAQGAGSQGSVIRFWDFAAAMKQISALEGSFTKQTTRN